MIQTKAVSEKRKQLKAQEDKLGADLEQETEALESKLKKSLKTLAIIGGSLAVAAAAYHLLSEEESPPPSKKSKKKTKNSSSNHAPSPITASVVTFAIQKLLPLILEKFKMGKNK